MTVTLKELKDELSHALGGGTVATQHTEAGVINRAGQHLYTMHSWKFAERDPINLSLVGSQPFIDLPDDLGEIVEFRRITATFAMTSLQTLRRRSAVDTVDSGAGVFSVAVVYPRTHPKDSALVTRQPHLRLVPTPSGDSADAVEMWWRSRWITLVDDGDISNVPLFAEELLREVVRNFARGLEEDNLKILLEETKQSQFFQDTQAADGRVQGNYGPLADGPVGEMLGGRAPFWLATESGGDIST